MTTFLENLFGGSIADSVFQPAARYHPYLDMLFYLKEDCSYRADRVDVYLTVLWHPQEDRLVGLKLKGVRFLFHKLQSIANIADNQWIPLVKALELALVHGEAQSLMDEVEGIRIRQRYEQARHIVEDVKVSPDEWPHAA